MLRIDPFQATDAEYAAIVAVENAISPDDPTSVQEAKHRDHVRNPDYLHARYLLRWNGAIVGELMLYEPFWAYAPGKYNIIIGVLPEVERRGIGTAAYEFGWRQLQTATPAPTLLHSHTRSDTPQGIRFLEARGFTPIMRWWTARLDLTAFDSTPYRPLLERLRAEGIELTTAAEFSRREADWQHKIYLTDREATLDEPTPGQPTPLAFDDYVRRVFDDPTFAPERYFLALDGDRVVGLSELLDNPTASTTIYTGFTGICRSHRRRGLATALKVVALDYAKRTGATIVHTGNEENNPMYQINLRLGFAPTVATLAYEKRVGFDK